MDGLSVAVVRAAGAASTEARAPHRPALRAGSQAPAQKDAAGEGQVVKIPFWDVSVGERKMGAKDPRLAGVW